MYSSMPAEEILLLNRQESTLATLRIYKNVNKPKLWSSETPTLLV